MNTEESDIEFHEDVALKPRGWGFDTDKEFPFHRLERKGNAFFVKLKYTDETDPDDLRKQEATLKRKLYVRATHAGKRVEIRRGQNKDEVKGLWVHWAEADGTVNPQE